MLWEKSANGVDFLRAEEERTMSHIIERDDRPLGVGDFIVFMVRACYARWVPGVEYVSFPDRRNGESSRAACDFTYGVHELDDTSCVAHGVVEAEGERESAALQTCHLLICGIN